MAYLSRSPRKIISLLGVTTAMAAVLGACVADPTDSTSDAGTTPVRCAQGLGAVQALNSTLVAITLSYSAQGTTPFRQSEDLPPGARVDSLPVLATAERYNYTVTRKLDQKILTSGTFQTVCGGQPVLVTLRDSAVNGGYPAPHSPMPEFQSYGGPVLANPVVQAITFPGDPFVAQLEKFTVGIGGTSYWAATTAEYGVSAVIAREPYHLTQAAPAAITDDEIQAMFLKMLDSADAHLGAADGNSLYVFYFPSTTHITFLGLKSCMDFDGYHGSVLSKTLGRQIAYAVVARCIDTTLQGTLDSVTETASHEMIEAVTDPQPAFDTAYAKLDADHAIWQTLLSDESADLCEHWLDSFYLPEDFSFKVQKSWSNVAAIAGRDPCAPNTSNEIYFNSSPVFKDTVTYQDPITKSMKTTLGTKIAVGASQTIDVDLYSEGPTDAWDLSAEELGGSGNLIFSFSQASGSNGDRVQLTIHVSAKNATYGAEVFAIHSKKNGVVHSWYGVVGN